MTPEQLTHALTSRLGQNLLSVILYGSVAADDQTKKYSNINILVVVNILNDVVLEEASPIVAQWRQNGNPTPLFLTAETLQTSRDVFPIEFSDMKSTHRVLHGNDSLNDIVIDHANLRHQLEFELRSKLIQLQTRYMETEGKAAHVRDLVLKSVSSVTVLFGAALRLIGENPPAKKRDIWKALSGHVNVDTAALEEILKLRDGGTSNSGIRELFSSLCASLQNVIQFVDQTK